MNVQNVLRRLRGAVGNAVVWGVAWSLAVLAVSGAMAIIGAPITWTGTWQLAARLSIVGGLAGGAFSTVIGLVYRGRRLADISWVRFGIGGGVVAGVFVPTLMFVGRTISGDGPLPAAKWISSALIAAVFGAVAAGASMKLAQRASTRSSVGDQEEPDALKAANPFESAGGRESRNKVHAPHRNEP